MSTRRRPSDWRPSAVVIAIALVLTTTGLALLDSRASRAVTEIGFWFELDGTALPAETTRALGGSISAAEMNTIVRASRDELERAFAGFRVIVTKEPRAFWRVVVLQGARSRPRVYPPAIGSAGEAMALGPLGGAGIVDFTTVARHAVRLAPAGATRREMIDGIARGIGRVAAHEIAHQIIGAAPGAHNTDDDHSYEYPSPDRAAQYYADIRWTTALPALREKVGR